ncbi:hypothetical protein KFL_001570220 [Klebsormidium nitens]|uniref:Cadherin-like beta-sandwich-like domain-containing protein n=1 Tax=Klebsormidium nitens TaxID=105231 RepID=A0A0U9HMG2_KLENI|nr:hypothetical protein KFL_001570220 [Klebsormidium nitens]|eukprot:GAQ83683.1 hypothetical protein KFL_001570220 [Klebsormidium nitens]
MSVLATAADPGSSITAFLPSGETMPITSGVLSGEMAVVRSGVLTLSVTASDNVTNQVYYFRLELLQGLDASLQLLYLSAGPLSPPFSPAILNYTVTVTSVVGIGTLLAVSTDSGASISANSGTAKKSQISQSVPIPRGASLLKVMVTSESLTNVTLYTITIQAPLSPPPSSSVTPAPIPLGPKPPPPTFSAPPPPLEVDSPVVHFLLGPLSPTSSQSAQLSFYATEGPQKACPNCIFYCALDSAPLQPCTFTGPPTLDPALQQLVYTVSVSALIEGAHSFQVRASGTVGKLSAFNSYDWVIDWTPPVTYITANVPSNRPTSIQNVAFSLNVVDTASDGTSAVLCPACQSQCAIDQGPLFLCPQSKPIAFFLGAGQHTFAVTSIDVAGNEESPPVRLNFVIELTPPEGRLTGQPPVLTPSNSASFFFVGSIAGAQARCAGCTFRCQLDQQSARSCLPGSGNTAGATYRNLTNGAHSFRLTTTDPDGVLSSTLIYNWTAVLVGPDVGIFYKPPPDTALSNATFKFSALAFGANASSPFLTSNQSVPCPGCLFYCSIDTGAAVVCDPGAGFTSTGLSEGAHTFSVRAEDVFGNVGAPTAYTWRVNFSLPLGSVISGPPLFGVTNSTSAVVTFLGTLRNLPCAGCTYSCQVNGNPFVDCDAATPLKLLNLQQGQQSLVVQVNDVSGASSLSWPYQWFVDTVPPTVAILSGPAPLTGHPSAQFALSATDTLPNGTPTACAECSYRCSLDGAPFQPCQNPVVLSNLGSDDFITAHVFRAVAADVAGNVALIPAVYGWVVDRRKPVIQLVSGPSNPSNARNGTVHFDARSTADSAGCQNCTAYCVIDGGEPFLCSDDDVSFASLSFTDLPAGLHTATVSFSNALAVSASYTHSWVADFTPPVPDVTLPASPVRENPVPVLVTFSEACLEFTCDSVTSCEVAVVGTALPAPNTWRSLGERQYTVLIDVIRDGPLTISIPTGVCQDAAWNPNAPATFSVNFQANPPQPVLSTTIVPVRVSVNGVSTPLWATNLAPIPFSVEFTEAVSGFDVNGISANGGQIRRLKSSSTGHSAVSPGSSSNVVGQESLVSIGANATVARSFSRAYTFEVWPLANERVTVQILADSCTDAIGSPNEASDAVSVLFDTSEPTVALSVSSSSATSIKIRVQFSERVLVPLNGSNAAELERADFGASQLSTSSCSVSDLVALSDGRSYLATVAQEGSVRQGMVWISGGAVVDLAGNPNVDSKVLPVDFGGVLGSLIATDSLATTVGISLGAAAPALLLGIFASVSGVGAAGLPAWAPLATPYVVQGNLLGAIGTVQTFALLRKLGVRQSEAFSNMASRLAWVNFESTSAAIAASAPSVKQSVPGQRRRLLQLDESGTRAASPSGLEPGGWGPSGLILMLVAVTLSVASILRLVLDFAFTRLLKRRLLPNLLFPRLELFAGLVCFYGLTQACAALVRGGSPGQVFAGALLLVLLPFSLILALLAFLTSSLILDSESRFEEEWKPPAKRTWKARAAAVLVGRACPGRWVNYVADDDTRPRSRFVGRFGLLFEALRPPSDARLFVLGRAREKTSATIHNRLRDSVGHRIESARRNAERDGESSFNVLVVPLQNPQEVSEGSPASFVGAARVLIRMLRTCHVAAVLTKRLLFGALLGAAGRRAAGAAPSLAQVWALLMTSAAYATWLVVGKPYVSRAVQGVEILTALLELLTLCLALQSGRAELKASQDGTVSEGSVRAFGTAMLVFQLLAITAQTGYQWWAVFVELRARWRLWARARERTAVAEKMGQTVRARGLAKGKQRGGKRHLSPNVRSRELNGVWPDQSRAEVWPDQSRAEGQPNGIRYPKSAHVRRGRGAAKAATSPPPAREQNGGAKNGTRALHRGGLKRRVSRGEEHANGESKHMTMRSEGRVEHRRGGVRKRAELDVRSERRARERKGGENGADILDEVVTRGTSDREETYWQEARIRDWARQSAENLVADRADVRGVRFEDASDVTKESREGSGALNGLARVLRFSEASALVGNGNGSLTASSGPEYLLSKMREGGMQKLLRLKSRRQERGLSSLTVFVVSEAESDEAEGDEARAASGVAGRRANLSAFTF